jgi:hypothetical protein
MKDDSQQLSKRCTVTPARIEWKGVWGAMCCVTFD